MASYRINSSSGGGGSSVSEVLGIECFDSRLAALNGAEKLATVFIPLQGVKKIVFYNTNCSTATYKWSTSGHPDGIYGTKTDLPKSAVNSSGVEVIPDSNAYSMNLGIWSTTDTTNSSNYICYKLYYK